MAAQRKKQSTKRASSRMNAKTAMRATGSTTSRKTASKKAVEKKPATKKSATKKSAARKSAAKKSAARKSAAQGSTRARASVRVVEIRPARGENWALFLSSGARVQVPAAAAQAAGVRVGGAWSDAVARRLAAAERSQELFARAMGFLAANGKATAAQVVAALGGGRDAAQTAKSLAEHGWLRR